MNFAIATAVPGLALSAMGPIHVATAFPPLDVTYDPNAPAGQPGQGGVLAKWVERHVVRPIVEWGPARYAPGEGQADYSGVATAATVGLAGLGAGFGGWTIYRAFFRKVR